MHNVFMVALKAKQTQTIVDVNQKGQLVRLIMSNIGPGTASSDPISERRNIYPGCSMIVVTNTAINVMAETDTVLKVEYEFLEPRT